LAIAWHAGLTRVRAFKRSTAQVMARSTIKAIRALSATARMELGKA